MARTVDQNSRTPQLLVSVRNASEAMAALAGGADIIDVKEPSRGSLGMADVATMSEVLATVEAANRGRVNSVPVSVALGETIDWVDRATVLPDGVQFAKLGPAALARSPLWESNWHRVRRAFAESARPPSTSAHRFQWVAVAYADWRAAAAPAPFDIVAAAARGGCSVVLLDTWRKDGSTLLDWINRDELRNLVESIRAQGMKVALAGGLAAGLVEEISALAPDIVGIRSAACREGQRTAEVSADAVRAFKSSLEQSPARPKLQPSATRCED